MNAKPSSFGPHCASGDACENRIFLEEYEKVDREHERHLVRQCAMLRAQVSKLEADITELRDPEEKRHDGKVVRKGRWEAGIRNIAHMLGMGSKEFEVGDVVERVRILANGDRSTSVPPSGEKT